METVFFSSYLDTVAATHDKNHFQSDAIFVAEVNGGSGRGMVNWILHPHNLILILSV